MTRPTTFVALACAALMTASPALAAPLQLVRVVMIQRHGVRPPTATNADLAKYSDQAWPDWPVPPGELTPHGGEVVKLMGDTLRAAYRAEGLLPQAGCPGVGEITVWADGADQRTRRSGEITAEALAPGCGIKAAWAPPLPRDPVFNGTNETACRMEPAAARAALISADGPAGLDTPAVRRAIAAVQSIAAPDACKGGKGLCLTGDDTIGDTPIGPRVQGPIAPAAAVAEDLLLEYGEGMPAAQVGWGRAASEADIAVVMAAHEKIFDGIRHNPYLGGRQGALMGRMVLAAMVGAPPSDIPGPAYGPGVKLVDFSGHDTNIALMGALFGLDWTLPGQPDVTSPAQTLAFEVWSDPANGRLYVKPVMYYEPLDQMRSLTPALATRLPLKFKDCSSQRDGGCLLADLSIHVQALIPPDCGDL